MHWNELEGVLLDVDMNLKSYPTCNAWGLHFYQKVDSDTGIFL